MIKKITIALFTTLLCFVSFDSMTYTGGPPVENTDAPSEGNCTSCHSGSVVKSGSNWNNLAFSSNFTGGGYIPDSTYTIKITFNQSSISKFGFQATILDGSNKMAGTFTASGRVQKSSSSGLSREYVYHTSTGTSTTGTNSTDWSFSWKAPNKNLGQLKMYITLNAADANSSSSGDVIYAKNFSINPSSLLPVANSKSDDSVTCAGNTITLKDLSTQNPTSWSWSLPGATPSASAAQNPSVKYNNAGSFWAILVAKNAKGVSKADSLRIVVRSKPSVTISGPTSYTICKGDSVKLTSTFNTNYSYTWAPGGFVSQTIFAKDTGSYVVTVKDNNKCTNTAGPIKLNHFASQALSITRDVTNDTVCFETPIKITASNTKAFKEFNYYTQAGSFQTTSSNPNTLKLSSSAKISVVGKDTNNCFSAVSNTFNFVVKNTLTAPSASCTDKTTAGFEISWNAVSGALGYEISMDSGKTWKSPSTGKKGLSHKVLGFPPSTDVLVWIKALDAFPCFESPITKVICGSIPCSPVSYDVVWDKEACKGKLINFKIRKLNTNFYSLKIDNGNAFKDTSFSISADFSRTYKFELTDSNNLSCPTIKRDAEVKVWEIPSLLLTSNNPQNIFCEGFPATFTADAKGMQEYNFFLNGVSKQKSNNATWIHSSPKNLDSIRVSITNGACVESSGVIKIGVKPLPNAKFTKTNVNRTVTFTPSEPGNTLYKWSFGDGTTKDTTKGTVTHKYAGSATKYQAKLTVIDPFGCTSSDSSEVTIPASVNYTLAESGILIYPQPAKNVFKIEIPSDLINAEISIMDNTGRVLFKTIADKSIVEIGVNSLANGLYTISVEKDNQRSVGKLIINR